MDTKAEVPDIRCIDDDNGSGLYYECTKVKVWLNLEEGTVLYSGQLLLIQEESNNDSVSKTSPQSSSRSTRTSSNSKPKQAQNNDMAAECSKIFSALKEADIQFNSSTSLNLTSQNTATTTTAPTTTESASIKTTDSSIAASKGSLSALKTKITTALPTVSYTKTVSTSSSDTLNGASGKASLFGTSAKLDSKAPFPVPTKNQTAPAVKTLSSTSQSSINSTSSATTTSAGVNSQFSFPPVFLGTNFTFSKTNTNPSAFTLEPGVTKTTPDLTVTTSGTFGSVSPFKTSPAGCGSSLLSKQHDSSSSSAFKAKKQGVTLGSGGTGRAAREECTGATKYPIPSNDVEYSDTASDSEEGEKKVTATVKKVRSDGKRERGSDHRRQRQGRMGRKADHSLENELLRAQLRCFQIQHSLYKILAAKLRNMESKSELQASENLSEEAKTGDVQSLLFPLEALLRCSDIQLGLHHGLSVAINETNAREGNEKDHTFTNTEQVSHMIYDKDELLIESRSLMNQTQFAKSLVCLHLSNPYALQLRYACGEDRIAISSINCRSWYVPHGEGKLVNLDGNLIYEGQWKKGKRWGYGKAFIFSGNELSASKKQYGIYEGNWWNNMRHGHGRLVFASCAVYEGEWQYDLMSGVGAMHSPDGSVLEGLWDEGEPSGCGLFTWPNGAVEYREYQNGQVIKVLQSPEETKRFSPLNEVMREYSVLRLKCQMLEEEKLKLVQSESQLMAQKAQADNYRAKLKQANQEKVKQLRAKFVELLEKQKKSLIKSHQQEMKDISERHDKKIKDLEEKIHQVEVELESKKSDLMCQICFERDRNCILMPCSHLLYCQNCIAKLHADSKPARCPSCRGMINSQINCNINH